MPFVHLVWYAHLNAQGRLAKDQLAGVATTTAKATEIAEDIHTQNDGFVIEFNVESDTELFQGTMPDYTHSAPPKQHASEIAFN